MNMFASDIFDEEMQQLTKRVENILEHKVLTEMRNLQELELKLNLKDNWKLDFSTVKIQFTLAEKEDKDKEKDKNSKKRDMETQTIDTPEMINIVTNHIEKTKISDSIPPNDAGDKPKVKTHFPSNAEILSLLLKIQPHVDIFEATLVTLRLWLELKKYKYETGHSFGSEVIEEISKQLKAYQDVPLMKKEYFESRVRMCQEIEKNHKEMDDAVWCVDILDMNYARSLEGVLVKIRGAYLIIYDLFRKNWTTIMNADGGHDLRSQEMYTN